MFRGTFEHTMDEKGRLSIPSKYRELLESHSDGQVVVTVDPDRCLAAYPFPEWERIEARLGEMSMLRREVRQLERFLVGNAVECELDRQGRILLPQNLRSFAGLQREVVVAGQIKKFELWDQEQWSQQQQQCLDSMEGAMEVLAELGL
ncbi:division/cell wall cluster transcriptional repressor MraZ [Thiohalorhabdus methylotrophus]|uniref:Transcriptional regulator MraZ n=1 Tax=Thiohalorhabdus methylotrophus TaxID=3242694 RepID=A0ABV4TXW8_9GAMM